MSSDAVDPKKKQEEEAAERRAFYIDLYAAVLLGIATVIGAYAAFQSSLWGGNCLTAYTQSTQKLGEANREMLRAVQEQSFDAVVWIENVKAHEVAKKTAESEADKHDEEIDDHAPNLTEDQKAELIVQSLEYTEDLTVTQKLSKLQKARTNLNDANKWADERYKKRIASLTPKDKLEIAKRILGYEKELEDVEKQEGAVYAKLGLNEESDEAAVTAALSKDANAKGEINKLEDKWREVQAKIEHEYEKLAKPLFFESPDYTKKQESSFKKLTDDGNKLMSDGKKFNGYGDKFTQTTVFFTIALFFAGLASVLKRQQIKIAFLVMGTLMFAYSVTQMFTVPFAS